MSYKYTSLQQLNHQQIGVKVMVFNATFNNISVLLVEKTGVNHRPAVSH